MKIAIITGGSGPERETSINSAKYISKNIDFAEKEVFVYPENFQKFLNVAEDFDVIIPVIHGEDGEDGELQKELEKRNIRYLFSTPDVHKKCFNKVLAKQIVSSLGYLVPETYKNSYSDIIFPVIVKPYESGSSVNLYYVENQEQLSNLGNLDGYICEQFVNGREYTVGVIDLKDKPYVLPIMEVKKKGAIFNNNEKTTRLSENIEVFPESLDSSLELSLEKITLDIHSQLEIKHLSRSDYIVNDAGDIYFIEINTIPGCSQNSFIPKMLQRAEMNVSEIIDSWIQK